MKRRLNWLQMAVVFLFLTSVLSMPVIWRTVSADVYEYKTTLQGVYGLLDDDLCREISGLKWADGRLEESGPRILKQEGDRTISILPGEEICDGGEEALSFYESFFVIHVKTGEGESRIRIPYETGAGFKEYVGMDDMFDYIGRRFVETNRAAIFLTMAGNVCLAVFGMNLILFLGLGLLVWLTGKMGGAEKLSFRGSLECVLNRMGIGTVFAAAAGAISGDITIMFLIQSILLILCFFVRFTRIYGYGGITRQR